MLRNFIYVTLALLAVAVIFVGIDGALHRMAIELLEKKGAHCDDWHYRYSGKKLAYNSIAPTGSWRGCYQRLIAAPREILFYDPYHEPGFGISRTTGVDRRAMRALALLRVEELAMSDCRGFSPEVASDLCRITSIRSLRLDYCDLNSDEVDLLWSRMPNLEDVGLMENEIGDDAFRDVKAARKLKVLSLGGTGITDRTIDRLREVPNLSRLHLSGVDVTEHSVALLAVMPALQWIQVVRVHGEEEIRQMLRERNPNLIVKGYP